MAERRMFAKTIIDSDAFLDMPITARLLYYDLAMRADDDGFVNSPKKIMRMIGASQDDLMILTGRKFIIPFDNGIVVIKHWRIHNYIRKDTYNETPYKEQKALLELDEKNAYTLRRRSVDEPSTQVRLGKDSIGKDRLVKYSDDYSIINKLTNKEQDSILKLCDSLDTYAQLIRYADAKIKSRTDSEPISDPYQYLIAVGVNGGFIKED
jgi:hypothetical protein